MVTWYHQQDGINTVVETEANICHGQKPHCKRASTLIDDTIGYPLHSFIPVLRIVLMLVLGFTLPQGDEKVANIFSYSPSSVHRSIVSNQFGGDPSIKDTLFQAIIEDISAVVFCWVGIGDLRINTNKYMSTLFTSICSWCVTNFLICSIVFISAVKIGSRIW